MTTESLVFICPSAEDARLAAAAFPREHGVRRLFLFVGEHPTSEERRMISEHDHVLCLERLSDWADNPLEVVIRAGMLYTSGWNVYFLWADRLPGYADLESVRQRLESGKEGFVRTPRLWAAERHQVALEGFGLDLVSAAPAKRPEEETLDFACSVSAKEMVQAMAGKPSGAAATLAALCEVVPLEAVSVDPSLQIGSLVHQFGLALERKAECRDDELPTLRVLAASAGESKLREALEQVPRSGAVVVLVTDQEVSAEGTMLHGGLTPYREFTCSAGFSALVFQNAGNGGAQPYPDEN